jgi:hypothetical protein
MTTSVKHYRTSRRAMPQVSWREKRDYCTRNITEVCVERVTRPICWCITAGRRDP